MSGESWHLASYRSCCAVSCNVYDNKKFAMYQGQIDFSQNFPIYLGEMEGISQWAKLESNKSVRNIAGTFAG